MGDALPDDDENLALGRLVSAVRRLEPLCYELARAAAVFEPRQLSVRGALREARRQLRGGLPPWSTGLVMDDVLRQIDETVEVFELRNRLVHWTPLHVPSTDPGVWVPARVAQRGRERFTYDPTEVSRGTAMALQLQTSCDELLRELMIEIAPNVFIHHPTLGGFALPVQVYWSSTDKAWPDAQDLDAVGLATDWARANPSDWQSWPIQRLHSQKRFLKACPESAQRMDSASTTPSPDGESTRR